MSAGKRFTKLGLLLALMAGIPLMNPVELTAEEAKAEAPPPAQVTAEAVAPVASEPAPAPAEPAPAPAVAEAAPAAAPAAAEAAPAPAAAPAAAETAPAQKAVPEPAKQLEPLAVLVPEKQLNKEKALNDAIREAFGKGDTASGLAGLTSRDFKEVGLAETVMTALEKNISVGRDKVRNRIAEESLAEARAVFTPVLRAAGNYSKSERFGRSQWDYRYKKATRNTNCGTAIDNCIEFEEGPVAYISYDKPRPAGYYYRNILASEEDQLGPSETTSYTIGVQQLLPWGASLNLTQGTTYKETLWKADPDDVNTMIGSYDRPWTSYVSLGGSTPLPFTKNFGSKAAQADVSVKLAGISEERAKLEVERQINDTLLAVDLAWWNLVGTVQNLKTTIEMRRNTERMVARTNRLYELQRVTSYDQTQTGAELARVKGIEASAWDALVQASNALNLLLGQENRQALYLPLGYMADGAKPLDIKLDDALRQALADNPGLKVQDKSLVSMGVLYDQREAQTRPDLNMNAAITASQSRGTFGYPTYTDSMGEVFNPDQVSISAGMNYNRPWGNREAKANLETARANKASQEFSREDLENQVARQVKNAHAALSSSRSRVEITKRSQDLAATSLQKALSLQDRETGRVTEYELIVKNSELLRTRLAHTQAKVEARKAEARLLAAMGAISKEYAERAAQGDVEKNRLQLLADNKLLNRFGESRP